MFGIIATNSIIFIGDIEFVVWVVWGNSSYLAVAITFLLSKAGSVGHFS